MDFFHYICHIFALDDFERFCVSEVFLTEFEDRALEGGGFAAGELTVGQLLQAWGKDIELSLIWRYFSKAGLLMRYFFVSEENTRLLHRRLWLHPRMMEMLLGEAQDVPEDWKDTMELTVPKSWKANIDPEVPKSRKAAMGLRLHKPQGNTAEPGEPGAVQGNGVDGLDEQPVARLKQLLDNRRPEESWLVGLCGPLGSGRRYTVRALFESLGKPLIIGDIVDKNVNDVLRECIFFQAGLMLTGEQWPEIGALVLRQLFQCLPVVFAASVKKHFYPAQREWLSVFWLELGPLAFKAAAALWKKALKGQELAPEVSFEEMAGKYTLYPGQIVGAAALALDYARSCKRQYISQEDLNAGCHELLSVSSGSKIHPVIPHFSWNELVLPEYQKIQLQTICSQIRQRNRLWEAWNQKSGGVYGRGISVVFSGLPGTGKTMAAQVVAKALGMDLYRADLAAVVSKYIGETEKNLEEIFEQAQGSQAILFFDEADVLFSKRTEVKSSNDKYSNMEAAYMLQKIEAYDGITILSTNYLQNFDEAFKRRMNMIIDFPFPDEEGRRRLWRQVYPESIEVAGEVDDEYLAKQFELSGSNIKNAAMFAAFLALDGGRPVSMADVAAGIKNEYAKIGKILRPEDTGEYYMLFFESSQGD